MALLLKAGREPAESWIEAFGRALPDLEVRVWPDCGDRKDIEFALVSRMPHGELRTFPNLRFIATMSVGLEHLFEDPQLPAHVPLIRSVNPQRAATMAEYVMMHVLRYHRRLPEYQAQQRHRQWKRLPQRLASEVRIGIMGLGTLGSIVGKRRACSTSMSPAGRARPISTRASSISSDRTAYTRSWRGAICWSACCH
jgi:glyoxylate/hydroxypyruvate reductase A